jgi:hypothetical protein
MRPRVLRTMGGNGCHPPPAACRVRASCLAAARQALLCRWARARYRAAEAATLPCSPYKPLAASHPALEPAAALGRPPVKPLAASPARGPTPHHRAPAAPPRSRQPPSLPRPYVSNLERPCPCDRGLAAHIFRVPALASTRIQAPPAGGPPPHKKLPVRNTTYQQVCQLPCYTLPIGKRVCPPHPTAVGAYQRGTDEEKGRIKETNRNMKPQTPAATNHNPARASASILLHLTSHPSGCSNCLRSPSAHSPLAHPLEKE